MNGIVQTKRREQAPALREWWFSPSFNGQPDVVSIFVRRGVRHACVVFERPKTMDLSLRDGDPSPFNVGTGVAKRRERNE